MEWGSYTEIEVVGAWRAMWVWCGVSDWSSQVEGWGVG